MNSMKRQKDMTPEDEPPRSEGVQHAATEEQRAINSSRKNGLNIQKTKIMASGPIISNQIEGEKLEAVTDFIFLGSKITLGSDCSYEIRRRLHLGRTAMANLDSILKSKDIILQTNVSVVKLCFFFFFPSSQVQM